MGEPPKKEYPPGWNDPPMLNYSPANPPPKSRITNRRIAFPLGAASSPSGGQPSESPPKMPPLLTSSIGYPCIENLYLKASENFNKSLESLDNESIKEKIWQMLSAWQNGKFSTNIQNLLTDLSVNMVKGNTTAVTEIHLRLSMTTEETSLVNIYLPPLKYLINPPGKT